MPLAAETGIREILQYAVTGITTGSVYAIVAVGFVLIFNATGIINFAQGEFVMLGMFVTIAVAGSTERSAGRLAVAVLVAVVVVALAGAALDRLALRGASRAGPLILLMVTIGVSAILRGLALLVWGPEPRALQPFTAGDPVSLVGVSVARQSFWVIGVAAVSVVALWLFFDFTRVGKAFRACEMNPLAARLVGIRPGRFRTVVFAAAAALAALIGAALAPITFATPDVGFGLGLNAFAAWVLGGVNSVFGAVAGGLGIGLVEAFARGYAPEGVRPYVDAIPFIILILVLLRRPEGLARSAQVRYV